MLVLIFALFLCPQGLVLLGEEVSDRTDVCGWGGGQGAAIH